MKKLVCLLVLATGLINLSFVNTPANDPKAQEILDAMSKKYKEMASFSAKFTYTLESGKMKETAEGEITVQGSKFRLKLGEQEIYNNGTTVWTKVDAKEVNKAAYNPEEDDYNPTKIFTMYKKGYKYILISEHNESGKTYSTVDLEPVDVKKAQITKVRIVINKKDKTVKSWKIFEKNGNRYVYTIKSFTPNVQVSEKDFIFDQAKHPGVTVIDLDE